MNQNKEKNQPAGGGINQGVDDLGRKNSRSDTRDKREREREKCTGKEERWRGKQWEK